MTPFDDEVGIAKLEERLGVLVRRYKELAPAMRDLPLYNDKVGVEAVDFMPFGAMGLGAFVTPWFISLVFLPLEEVAYDPDSVGRTAVVDLPAGQRSFSLGGDEVTGLYWAHSVLSPLNQVVSHDAAVALARARLTEALTVASQPSGRDCAADDEVGRPAPGSGPAIDPSSPPLSV